MLSLLKRIRQDKEGATVIEFAFVAPILFLFIFGIMEYGLIMFAASAVEGGTGNAARLAKTGADQPSDNSLDGQRKFAENYVRKAIKQRGGIILDTVNNLKIDIVPQGGSPKGTLGAAGEMVIYTAVYHWDVITPFLREILGENGVVDLSSVTVIYNEPK